MRKQTITKDDGRYLIFYTFEKPTSAGPDAPSFGQTPGNERPVESHPVASMTPPDGSPPFLAAEVKDEGKPGSGTEPEA